MAEIRFKIVITYLSFALTQQCSGIFEPHNTKCFSFDKREKSQFYICNRLWEMMDSSNEWKNLVTKESSKQKDAAPLNVISVHMGDCEG